MCLQCLALLGYRPETDLLPVRVEYAAAGRGWIDVHPVVFDDPGQGRQQALGGDHFDYPAAAFTSVTFRVAEYRASR